MSAEKLGFIYAYTTSEHTHEHKSMHTPTYTRKVFFYYLFVIFLYNKRKFKSVVFSYPCLSFRHYNQYKAVYMEMEFVNDVKWATLLTVSDAHRRPRRRHYEGNKSRMSQVDVNDASIMASWIQP